MKKIFLFCFIALPFLLSGCLYSVKKGVALKTMQTAQGLKTGRTSIFTSGDLYISERDIINGDNSIYKNNDGLYTFVPYGSKYNEKYIYHILEDNYFVVNKKDKIKNSNLELVKLVKKDNNCKKNCVYMGEFPEKNIKFNVFNGRSAGKFGSDADLIVEYIDYSDALKSIRKDLSCYALIDMEKSVSEDMSSFIGNSEIANAIDGASTIKQLDITEKNLDMLNKKSINIYDYILEKRDYLHFLNAYNAAEAGGLVEKREFLEKYKSKATVKDNCYRVISDVLSIKEKNKSKSRNIGQYWRYNIVCMIDKKGDWIKSEIGWVESKYLKKIDYNDKYNKLYIKIAIEVEKEDYQLVKKDNTVNGYLRYINSYPDSANKSKAYEVLLGKFIKESGVQALRKEFKKRTFIDNHDVPLLKTALIERLRSLKTIEGFSEAYEYSHDADDLQSVLDRTTTIKDLDSFITKYKDAQIVKKAKKKLAPLYRKKDTFSGYLSAYKLLYDLNDAEKASSKAQSTKEMASVEQVVFEAIPHKEALITGTISNENVRYNDYEGGGFFAKHSFSGEVYPRGKLSVQFKNDAPFRPTFGVYKVDVTVEAVVPLHHQRRSKWLGSVDENDEYRKSHVVSFTFKPPYNKLDSNFDIGETGFVFFERGSAGGYTAKWPRDNMYLSIKNITVSYAGESVVNSKKLHIDFNNLSKFNPSVNYRKMYIDGSYSKGSALISKFDRLDDVKNAQYSSYSSSSYDSGSSTPSSSSNHSNSSSSSSSSRSQNNSGVKEVYNGGYKSSDGYPIYIVKCKQGSKFSAFQKSNGYWFDSSGSNYGDRYRNLSLDDFAAKKCDY